MAWSDGAIGADELTAKAAGYPLVVGSNVLETYNALPQWRTTGSWASGSDVSLSGYPARLAIDRRAKTYTMPDISGTPPTSISLIFDCNGSSRRSGEADVIAILGHNFHLCDPDSINVDIADTNDFTGGSFVTMKQWSSASNWETTNGIAPRRLISLGLTGSAAQPRRINTIRYVRVQLNKAAGFTVAPQIGEVILGRRCQFTTNGQLPFPDRPLKSESVSMRTNNGDLIRHALWSGAGDRTIMFNLGGTNIGVLDMETSLRDFQDHIDYGQKSFLYIQRPDLVETDHRAWLMSLEPPEFNFTQLGFAEEEVEMSMVEQPPFVSSEVEF